MVRNLESLSPGISEFVFVSSLTGPEALTYFKAPWANGLYDLALRPDLGTDDLNEVQHPDLITYDQSSLGGVELKFEKDSSSNLHKLWIENTSPNERYATLRVNGAAATKIVGEDLVAGDTADVRLVMFMPSDQVSGDIRNLKAGNVLDADLPAPSATLEADTGIPVESTIDSGTLFYDHPATDFRLWLKPGKKVFLKFEVSARTNVGDDDVFRLSHLSLSLLSGVI